MKRLRQSSGSLNPRDRHSPRAASRRPARSAPATIGFLLAGAYLLAGCQNEPAPVADEHAAPAPAAAAAADTTTPTADPTASVRDCPLQLDTGGLAAYQALTARLARGESPAPADYDSLAAQPSYAAWIRSQPTPQLNAHILANVMRYVHGEPSPDRQGRSRQPKRVDLVDNLTFLRDRADSTAALLTRLRTDQLICRAHDLVTPYVAAPRWPDRVTVAFLAASPELRYLDDHLLVDAGLAVAAGPELLVRLIASVLYRDLQSRGAQQPHLAATGTEALVATFTKLGHEAVAAWLEGYETVAFDRAHPQLGQSDTGRRDVYQRAANAIQGINDYLDYALMGLDEVGQQALLIDDLLRGLGAYAPAGYAMAALIVQTGGEERLQASSRSPAAFVAAYQAAARQTYTGGQDRRQGGDVSGSSTLPPFPEPAYGRLLAVLQGQGGGR